MNNRLTHLLNDEPPEPEWSDDVVYFELITDGGRHHVTPETRDVIAAELARRRTPRWLRFVDMFGAAVLVRTKAVRALVESTPEQRASERGFRRLQRMDEMREIHEEFRGLDWPDWGEDPEWGGWDDGGGDCLT